MRVNGRVSLREPESKETPWKDAHEDPVERKLQVSWRRNQCVEGITHFVFLEPVHHVWLKGGGKEKDGISMEVWTFAVATTIWLFKYPLFLQLPSSKSPFHSPLASNNSSSPDNLAVT